MGYGSDLLGPLQSSRAASSCIRAEVLSRSRSSARPPSSAPRSSAGGQARLIAPGAFADLLVVDGNPLRKLELFLDQGAHLPAIMKAGKFHKNALK